MTFCQVSFALEKVEGPRQKQHHSGQHDHDGAGMNRMSFSERKSAFVPARSNTPPIRIGTAIVIGSRRRAK
jgi:hypothetical protein